MTIADIELKSYSWGALQESRPISEQEFRPKSSRPRLWKKSRDWDL